MSRNKKRPSISEQKKALRDLVAKTPVEDLLPNKNRKAVELLKKAGLLDKKD